MPESMSAEQFIQKLSDSRPPKEQKISEELTLRSKPDRLEGGECAESGLNSGKIELGFDGKVIEMSRRLEPFKLDVSAECRKEMI